MINYPLVYSFKKAALTNRVNVKDAGGFNLMHAHQKMFKLKEKILIFTDESKAQELGQINANKVIDFSPTYTFTGMDGAVLSTVKRKGKKSIWRANYEIYDGHGQLWFMIREENVWAKVLDAILGQFGIIGLILGYYINPRYNIWNTEGSVIGTIAKQPAIFEGEYHFDCPNPAQVDPANILPSGVLMTIIRERFRG